MDASTSRYELVSRRALLKASVTIGAASLVAIACGNNDVDVLTGAFTDQAAPQPAAVDPLPTTAPLAAAEPAPAAATAEPEVVAESTATAEPEVVAESTATAEPEVVAESTATAEPEVVAELSLIHI